MWFIIIYPSTQSKDIYIMLNDKSKKGQMKIPSPSTNLKSHSKEKKVGENIFL